MNELSIAKVYKQIVNNLSVNPKHSGAQLKSLKVRRKDDEEYKKELDDKLQREIKQIKSDLDKSGIQKNLKLRDFYNNLATDSKRMPSNRRDVAAIHEKETPVRLEVPVGRENDRGKANQLQIQVPDQLSSERTRSQVGAKGKKSPNSSLAGKPKSSQSKQRPAINVVQPTHVLKSRAELPSFSELIIQKDKRLDTILSKFGQLRRAYEEELILAEMRINLSSKNLNKIEPVLDVYDSYLTRTAKHLGDEGHEDSNRLEVARSDSDTPSKHFFAPKADQRDHSTPSVKQASQVKPKVYLPKPARDPGLARPSPTDTSNEKPGPLKSEIMDRLEQANRMQQSLRRPTKPLSERRKTFFDTSFSGSEGEDYFEEDLPDNPPPSQADRVSLSSDIKQLYGRLMQVFTSKQITAASVHDCEVMVDAVLRKEEVYPLDVAALCRKIAPQLSRARITLGSDQIDARGGQAIARNIGYERYIQEKIGGWLLDIEDLVDEHEEVLAVQSGRMEPRPAKVSTPLKLTAPQPPVQNNSDKKSVRIREPPRAAQQDSTDRSLWRRSRLERPFPQGLQPFVQDYYEEHSEHIDNISQERNREIKNTASSKHPNSFVRVLATESSADKKPQRITPKKSILKRPSSSDARESTQDKDNSSVSPVGRIHTTLYYKLPQNPTVSSEYTRKRREVQSVADTSVEFSAKLTFVKLLTSGLLCVCFEAIDAAFIVSFPSLVHIISLELPAAVHSLSTVRLQTVEDIENDIVQKHLAVADAAGWVHLYSLYTFQLLERFSAHTSAVEAVIETAFCRGLVTCDRSGVLRVWNVRDKTEVSLSQSFMLSEILSVFSKRSSREAVEEQQSVLLFVDDTHFVVRHCGDVYLFAARELMLGHISIECKCFFTAASLSLVTPMSNSLSLVLHSGQNVFMYNMVNHRLSCIHKHPAGQSLQLYSQANRESSFVIKSADRKSLDMICVVESESFDSEERHDRHQVYTLASPTIYEACGKEVFLAIEIAGTKLNFSIKTIKRC